MCVLVPPEAREIWFQSWSSEQLCLPEPWTSSSARAVYILKCWAIPLAQKQLFNAMLPCYLPQTDDSGSSTRSSETQNIRGRLGLWLEPGLIPLVILLIFLLLKKKIQYRQNSFPSAILFSSKYNILFWVFVCLFQCWGRDPGPHACWASALSSDLHLAPSPCVYVLNDEEWIFSVYLGGRWKQETFLTFLLWVTMTLNMRHSRSFTEDTFVLCWISPTSRRE